MTFSMLPNLLFSLLLLLPLVSAVTTSTLELCSTEYGGSSISPVPSITYTENTSQHLTAKTTITPTVTVTPKPVTVQSTSIEVKTVTSYSTTVTFTDTDTVEVYITSTGKLRLRCCKQTAPHISGEPTSWQRLTVKIKGPQLIRPS